MHPGPGTSLTRFPFLLFSRLPPVFGRS